MYHLGQNNNCNVKNAIWVKGTNMDQLVESFQGLRQTSGSNSPVMNPTLPNRITQPAEGPESAESEEEGELRPSPVVSAQSAEEGELRPSPVTRRKKIAAVKKERDPRARNEKKTEESKSVANAMKTEKKTKKSKPIANAKPSTSRRASVEEIMQPPADNSKPQKLDQ